MEKKINERLIKVSGKTPVNKTLDLGDDVVIQIKGSVVKEEKYDNNDGTFDMCWVVKSIEMEIIE